MTLSWTVLVMKLGKDRAHGTPSLASQTSVLSYEDLKNHTGKPSLVCWSHCEQGGRDLHSHSHYSGNSWTQLDFSSLFRNVICTGSCLVILGFPEIIVEPKQLRSSVRRRGCQFLYKHDTSLKLHSFSLGWIKICYIVSQYFKIKV